MYISNIEEYPTGHPPTNPPTHVHYHHHHHHHCYRHPTSSSSLTLLAECSLSEPTNYGPLHSNSLGGIHSRRSYNINSDSYDNSLKRKFQFQPETHNSHQSCFLCEDTYGDSQTDNSTHNANSYHMPTPTNYPICDDECCEERKTSNIYHLLNEDCDESCINHHCCPFQFFDNEEEDEEEDEGANTHPHMSHSSSASCENCASPHSSPTIATFNVEGLFPNESNGGMKAPRTPRQDSGPSECQRCSRRRSRQAKPYVQHRWSIRSPTPVKYHYCQFPNCQMRFKRLEHLKRHLRTHTLEKPFECPYQGCGKTFSRRDNLRQHLKTHEKRSRR